MIFSGFFSEIRFEICRKVNFSDFSNFGENKSVSTTFPTTFIGVLIPNFCKPEIKFSVTGRMKDAFSAIFFAKKRADLEIL